LINPFDRRKRLRKKERKSEDERKKEKQNEDESNQIPIVVDLTIDCQ
jgi:hypothetical protein